jgi:hypothetical protein
MTENTPPNVAQLNQLHRDLIEKVIDRAASDPAWKQQLLDNPEETTAEFPETQRFLEIYQSATPEAMPVPQEEFRQLQRSLWAKMIDKAAGDPLWKQRLLDDPRAATAEFPEFALLTEMRQQAEEVRGQQWEARSDPYYELNWWGKWRTVRLNPVDFDFITSGGSKVGGSVF